MLLHQLGSDTDDMLPLPILDHVQGLQGADDVILCDARHLAVPRETTTCATSAGTSTR